MLKALDGFAQDWRGHTNIQNTVMEKPSKVSPLRAATNRLANPEATLNPR